MINQFDIWSTQLTFFVALNWSLTLASAAVFLATYARRRFLFVKPSIVLLLMAHIFFQWPLAIYAGYYETWLPDPYALVLLVHGFVLAGFAGSRHLFAERARRIWTNLGAVEDPAIYRRPVFILFAACLACIATYLSYVPIDCTGLYALVFDPSSQPLAREISMKLQVSPVPRYAMSVVQMSIVPLMTAFAAVSIIQNGFRGGTLILALAVLAAWCMAFIPGAKGTLVTFGLVVAATYLWAVRLKLNIVTPVMLAASLVPALAVATLFSFGMRNDSVRDISTCFQRMNLAKPAPVEELIAALDTPPPPTSEIDRAEADRKAARHLVEQEQPNAKQRGLLGAAQDALNTTWRIARKLQDAVQDMLDTARRIARNMSQQIGSIVYRAIIVPFQVGGWYVHNLQTNGPVGIAGIPRLAEIAGVPPIAVPQIIGRGYGPLYYGRPVDPTIWASSGFVFSYYSYFGLWALPVILLAAWSTDIAVLVLGLLSRPFVLPVLSAFSISTLKFVESDFTTVWLTHGFGVILILGLLLSLIVGRRAKTALPR